MAETPFTPFDAEGGLILATRLPGSPEDFDSGRRGWDDLGAPPSGPPLWIHLDRTCPRAQQWIREQSGLDPLAGEALLAEETRPGAQTIGVGLLVILRGINLNPGAEPDELISIRIWIEPSRVISLRQFRFQTTAAIRARAQRGQAPATPGSFLAAMAGGLAARITPSVTTLEDQLDTIEDEMLDHDPEPHARRSQLATVRRQAIAYRRFLVPQRDALIRLASEPAELLSDRDRTELRLAAEQVARSCEAMEEVRDRAAVTQEEMRGRHDERMGRTLYLLTIVATIALPLALITGLLGINVGGIPMADSPWGFVAVSAILVAIGTVEIVLFRWMRWL